MGRSRAAPWAGREQHHGAVESSTMGQKRANTMRLIRMLPQTLLLEAPKDGGVAS